MCDDYPWRQWDRKGVIEKPLDGNGHRGAPDEGRSGRAQMVLRKDQASGRAAGRKGQ